VDGLRGLPGGVKEWAVRNQVIPAVAVLCAMQHRVGRRKGETCLGLLATHMAWELERPRKEATGSRGKLYSTSEESVRACFRVRQVTPPTIVSNTVKS
jgi:hypothetical protein